jgi:putative hydrolase of the HAD superfamily
LIATNQEHNRANYLMNELGFSNYFDEIYHSAKIGFAKPNRSYFEKVMEFVGELDEPPIFFDDTQSVVDAANDFGWEAHQFDDIKDLNKSSLIASLLP